jgi:hypothetical protein
MSEVTASRTPGSGAPTLDELHILSDDEVAEQITTWAGRIAAGEARLLAYVGEFDAREAWGGAGLLSCAHWMSWRLGMGLGLGAAYKRVRVARALRELPATRAAFAAGQLSWTQVRAITRTATPEEEQTYLHLARHAAGAQIERLTRGVRRARKLAAHESNPDSIKESARCDVRYDEDGTMVITARLPAEHGAVVLAALEQARADLDEQRRTERLSVGTAAPDDATCSSAPASGGCGQNSSAEDCAVAPTESRKDLAADDTDGDPRVGGRHSFGQGGLAAVLDDRDGEPGGDAGSDSPACGQNSSTEEPVASRADGLVRLSRHFLDHRGAERPDAARRSRSRLTVRLDPLSGWARLPDGELLPPVAALTVCDLGRDRREPDLALRELLGTVDGERCRFPGCTRRRKLHAHHVREWSAGGRTDLANLILLCSRHHTLVHADGHRLSLHADRRLDVATACGTPIPHLPAPPWQPATDLDHRHSIGPGTLPQHATQRRIDLGYAVSVLVQQAA